MCFQNYKNPNLRSQIKERLLSESKNQYLPLHRKVEIESQLYYIECFEKIDNEPLKFKREDAPIKSLL